MPSVNDVEPKQQANTEAKDAAKYSFLPVLRTFDHASVFFRPEIAVGQALVKADDFAALPFGLPLRCAKAMGQVNESSDRPIAWGWLHGPSITSRPPRRQVLPALLAEQSRVEAGR